MYYPYYYDPTYIILIPAIILTMYAQFKVSSTTNRYFRVRTQRGYTGEQTAREILNANGIYDVRIEMTRGTLSDHYDPRNKILRLSQDVYRGTSITSVAVAAHECGHAIQHARGYAPLTIRGAIVPVVNFNNARIIYDINYISTKNRNTFICNNSSIPINNFTGWI